MLKIKRLHENSVLPAPQREGDAAFDLYSVEDVIIRPGHTVPVGTGIAVELFRTEVGLVCPRSGLAAKNAVTVLNAPGIVDPNFRGEVKVILHNASPTFDYHVKVGDRIAQLLVLSLPFCIAQEVDELTEDLYRGQEGLGSSGR
jgi:dUTP pyrophosphatase